MKFTMAVAASLPGFALGSVYNATPKLRSNRNLPSKQACDNVAALENCFLVNLIDKAEIKLQIAAPTIYVAESRYSVYCATTTSRKKLDYVKFTSSDGAIEQTEYKAPWFLKGDYNGWINPVGYLSTPCGEMKEFEVKGYVWGQANEPCFSETFELFAKCPGDDSTTPSLVPSSNSPSGGPSSSPSLVPSLSPSVSPSGMPSVSPSFAPSSGPSGGLGLPTSSVPSGRLPSFVPSSAPSVSPTGIPSQPPTPRPESGGPTGGLDCSNSFIPSGPLPSLVPTSAPSVWPSGIPSVSPTFGPSSEPSGGIGLPTSSAPSALRGVIQSSAPSDFPSIGPSAPPTREPSPEPSGGLGLPTSSVPSGTMPSVVASPAPSIFPSDFPSIRPTTVLSSGPSGSELPTTMVPQTVQSVRPSGSPPSFIPVSNFPSSTKPSTDPYSKTGSLIPSFVPSTPSSLAPVSAPQVTTSTDQPTKPHQDVSSTFRIGVAYEVPGLTEISEPEVILLRQITANYLYDLLLNYLQTDRTCNIQIQDLSSIDPVDVTFNLGQPDDRFNLYVKYSLSTFWNSDVDCGKNYPPLKAAIETHPRGVYAAMLASSVLINVRDVHWFDLECGADELFCDLEDF